MHVDFKGYLKEQVGEGAQIDVIVKYGAIRYVAFDRFLLVISKQYIELIISLFSLLHKVFDLCEQAPQVDKECPIEKGEFTANKTVALPKDIPPVSSINMKIS
jgi:hypothetical protein